MDILWHCLSLWFLLKILPGSCEIFCNFVEQIQIYANIFLFYARISCHIFFHVTWPNFAVIYSLKKLFSSDCLNALYIVVELHIPQDLYRTCTFNRVYVRYKLTCSFSRVRRKIYIRKRKHTHIV